MAKRSTKKHKTTAQRVFAQIYMGDDGVGNERRNSLNIRAKELNMSTAEMIQGIADGDLVVAHKRALLPDDISLLERNGITRYVGNSYLDRDTGAVIGPIEAADVLDKLRCGDVGELDF